MRLGVQFAPAWADHNVDPLYYLLGLQSKICLEGTLNFAFCGSLTERSHDPLIHVLHGRPRDADLNEIHISSYFPAHDMSEG